MGSKKYTITTDVETIAELNKLMTQMLSHESLDSLMKQINELFLRFTASSNVLLLLVDDVGEQLTAVAGTGEFGKANIGQHRKYGEGFAGLAWSTKEIQHLSNSDELTVTKGFWPPNSQLIAVPLIVNLEVIGVSVLCAPVDNHHFTKTMELVRHFANIAGISIVNVESKQRHQIELSRMRALRDISEQLQRFDSEFELIKSVSKTLMYAMDVCRVVYFYVESDGITEHSNILTKKDGVIESGKSFTENIMEEGVNGWCYKNNEPVFLERYHNDKRESDKVRKIRIEENIGSTFCVPINSKNRVVAVISISRELSKRDFNENDRNLFFSICSQISTALYSKELLEDVKYRATHDNLTELPNRYSFETQLSKLVSSTNEGEFGAVLFIDLDGFKSVNDSLGHHFGDKLLSYFAKRLQSILDSKDVIARIGGDEFGIILTGLSAKDQALQIADRIMNSVSTSFEIKGVSVRVGMSVGMSLFPNDGSRGEVLIRNADEAMYRAKQRGRGQVVCFSQEMADESQRRIQLENELNTAMIEKEFELYFQPQVNTASGVVEGVEALLRWNHKQRGVLTPASFIQVAEESGAINQIGLWVIEQAIKQLSDWGGSPMENLRIGVNVAASQFIMADLGDVMLSMLEKHSVCPTKFEVEVTESLMMKEMESVVQVLHTLRSAGVSVAVDDFGTGYSSLSYLQELPLDVLKIDRSFVNKLSTDNVDESIVKMVMLLARSLQLKTIAEGVETVEQYEAVQRLGCTSIQGYYFSKPVPANKLLETINRIESFNLDTSQRKVG